MKRQVLLGAIVYTSALGAFEGSPAVADDRELQAILAKQGCVAGNIGQTELSSRVVVYEVTCRRSGQILTIVCMDTGCQLQPKARQDEQGSLVGKAVDG